MRIDILFNVIVLNFEAKKGLIKVIVWLVDKKSRLDVECDLVICEVRILECNHCNNRN